MTTPEQTSANDSADRQPWRFPATIVSRKKVATATIELQLAIADPQFSFLPGQYLWLVLPKLRSDDPAGSRRAFSIASAPTAGRRVTLVYRDHQSGYHRTLNELPLRSQVECLGPFGRAFIIPAQSPDLVLIAAGVGVAPFLSLLRAAPVAAGPHLTLLWYNTSEDRTPYRSELEQLAGVNSRLTVRFFNRHFAIDDAGPNDRDVWYICGPQGMVNAVAQAAQAHGLNPQQLHFEQHYPQAPGTADLRHQLAEIRRHSFDTTIASTGSSRALTEVIEKVVPSLLIVGSVLSALIGLGYFWQGQSPVINLVTAAALLLTFVLWRRTASRPLIINLLLALIFTILLWAATSGGTDRSGIFWVGIFPLLALLILPRQGLWWATSFIVCVFGLAGLRWFGFTRLGYASSTYFQEALFLILITTITELFLRAFFRLEEQLRSATNQERVFHEAIETSTSHVVITDGNGAILYANPAAQRITGFTLAEMAGQTPRLWGGLMGEDFYHQLWQTRISGQPLVTEITNHRKNHELYTAIAHISPIVHPRYGITGYVATEEDISDQKRQIEIASRLAAIVASSDDVILSKTLDGTITSWNRSATAMYGYRPNEMIGQSINIIVPDDRRLETKMIMETVARGQSIDHFQTVRQRKNGSLVDVSITVSPIRDQSGRIVGASTIARDITKEKQIDRVKTEFVSLASHQLRTPLSAINWYTEMLLNGDAGRMTRAQRNYLQEIFRGNQRMIGLVNALLNVSRLELGTFAVEPQPTDLIALADDVVKELRVEIRQKKLKLVRRYQAGLPVMSVDPKLTRIIFQNLLSNAVKYTPARGTVTLRLDRRPRVVRLTCKDTGYGIPADAQPKIFTKLFRADNIQPIDTDGTGLGLYIVKSIVEQSGGRVWFDSTENRGTTFYVDLPLRGMVKKAGDKSLTPA